MSQDWTNKAIPTTFKLVLIIDLDRRYSEFALFSLSPEVI